MYERYWTPAKECVKPYSWTESAPPYIACVGLTQTRSGRCLKMACQGQPSSVTSGHIRSLIVQDLVLRTGESPERVRAQRTSRTVARCSSKIRAVTFKPKQTAFTAPVAAATEYYVAQDTATKKCSIVTKKPDGKKMMDVGMMMYKTKADAEKAMKASAGCK
jgi:hypothetical protein